MLYSITRLYTDLAYSLYTVMVQESETSADKRAPSIFPGEKYLVIESYRKNGEPVRTPVWFIEHQGTLYVRTGKDTGKAKRIRRDANIRIAPCSGRGTPKAAWVEAEARPATDEEAQQTYRLLKQKYGLTFRLVELIRKRPGRKDKPAFLAIKTRTP